jgi:carbon storage regulator CsrA
MVVLTRELAEEIVIDGEIRIGVLSIRGTTVRLAIEVPPSISVDRRDLDSAVSKPAPMPIASEQQIA